LIETVKNMKFYTSARPSHIKTINRKKVRGVRDVAIELDIDDENGG